MSVSVTGAGGFIGGHLVKRLLADGHAVRAADKKPLDEWWQVHDGADNLVNDLIQDVDDTVNGVDAVYHLAEDMGGIGHIETHRLSCSVSIVPSITLLQAAMRNGVSRFFFSSSACVYNTERQARTDVAPLKESDAFPSLPEAGYGEEKLFFEQVCRYAQQDGSITTRIARFHNVFGPNGSFEGGREKAPGALARKIAVAKLTGDNDIEVWGDGEQTRSFMYVDDCVEGTIRIMSSDVDEPLNLGSSELVTINQLVHLIAEIAGVEVKLVHNLDAPKGVRGRNSDNTLIQERLGWEPSTPLRDGLERTYAWVYDQVKASL